MTFLVDMCGVAGTWDNGCAGVWLQTDLNDWFLFDDIDFPTCG